MKMVKKTLSITVVVAMMVMSLMSMGLVSAETAQTGPISMIPATQPDGATLADGILTVTGAADTAVTYEVNQTYNILNLPNLFYEVSSTANFDITFHTNLLDSASQPAVFNVGIASDFAPTDGGTAYVDAGNYDSSVPFGDGPAWWDTQDAYLDVVPDNGTYTIASVTITLKSEGTLVLSDLYMNDEKKAYTPDNTMKDSASLLTNDASDWVSTPGDEGTSVAVSKTNDVVTITNVGGSWPCGKVTFDSAITVNVATDELEYDFTVQEGNTANIIIFFNGSLWQSVSLNPLIDTSLNVGDDLQSGTYKGSIPFSAMQLEYTDGTLPATWITDGKIDVSDLKVYNCNQDGGTVVLNKLVVRVPKESLVVTFNSQGGSAVASQTVLEQGKAVKPSNPAKNGFAFGGWYKEAACTTAYDFNSAVSADITLFAKWTTAAATPTTAVVKQYVKKSLVSAVPSAWTIYNADDATVNVSAVSGGVKLTNVGGLWPSAGYALSNPVTATVAKDLLSFDLTVGGKTNIIIFFNGATPDSYTEGQFLSISKYINAANTDENNDLTGNGAAFKSTVALSEIDFPAGIVSNGKINITGIKFFNVGESGSEIVIRDMSIAVETAAAGNTENPTTGNALPVSAIILVIVSGAALTLSRKSKLLTGLH